MQPFIQFHQFSSKAEKWLVWCSVQMVHHTRIVQKIILPQKFRGTCNSTSFGSNRQADGWRKPAKLGENINTHVSETFPSITNDGTICFSRASENPRAEHIYRSRLINGHYTTNRY